MTDVIVVSVFSPLLFVLCCCCFLIFRLSYGVPCFSFCCHPAPLISCLVFLFTSHLQHIHFSDDLSPESSFFFLRAVLCITQVWSTISINQYMHGCDEQSPTMDNEPLVPLAFKGSLHVTGLLFVGPLPRLNSKARTSLPLALTLCTPLVELSAVLFSTLGCLARMSKTFEHRITLALLTYCFY